MAISRLIVMVCGVVGLLAGNCAHGAMLGPVEHSVRQAESGWQIAYARMGERYAEYAAPGSTFTAGATVDSEQGPLSGGAVGYRHESRHLAYGVVYSEETGDTSYQGYSQDPQTASYTPLTGRTQNARDKVQAWLRYAFTPGGLSNLVILPGVLVGGERWRRVTPDQNTETYQYECIAGTLTLQHAMGPVVLSVSGAMGRTLYPVLHSSLIDQTLHLGTAPWRRYAIQLTYDAIPAFSLFARYAQTRFGFGMSQASSGVYEPHSQTTEEQGELGMLVRF